MADIVTAFNPASTDLTKVSVPQSARTGGIVIWNESNISLNLTFQDGTTMYLPGWYHRHKCGYAGDITWALRTTLNSPNPPTSEVIVEMYTSGEHFPSDGPIVRQTNGSAAAQVTSTNQIVNTGNPPLTNIITAQPNDATAQTWLADTSGNLLIRSDNAGALTNLLQLVAGVGPEVIIAAASVITQIAGAMTVGSDVTVTGHVDATGYVRAENGSFYGVDGSNTILQSTGTTGSGNTRLQNTDHISLQVPGGSEAIGINSTTTTMESSAVNVTGTMTLSHSLNLVNGSIGQLKQFSGTGNGTFASGITNPTGIAPDPCTVSGSSQTIGMTVVSSPVVTTGAGLAWSATAWHS